jgi:archaellum component FlaC
MGGVYTNLHFLLTLFTESINSNILDIRVRENKKLGDKIKMQKIKAKIITAMLLAALALTLVPLAFASTGNILINDTLAPQDLPITPVPAGANITLYFGGVTFSGSQFYLLLSQDGLSQVSTGDIRYTPLFNVASVGSATVTQVTDAVNFPGGAWTLGDGWVNGSIPLNIAGGTYFIKAFDGFTTALAVTQGFTVTASLRIIPDAGSAGTAIIVSGNAFPTNALVNLSYVSVSPPGNIVRFANLTQSNALGQFNFTMPAPDLMIAAAIGDNALVTNTIQFTATENATAASYTAIYTESQRGLVQFGEPNPPGPAVGSLQNATVGIYGNLTSFVSTVSVGVGDTVRIVGNSFYPGSIAIRWDNSVDLASATANQTGWFNTTVTVPAAGTGAHNITLIDAGLQVFAVFLTVEPSITVSPTTGPIGTTVTVNGFGFPAATGGNFYNATITFSGVSGDRAGSLTDANGQFTATFNVPTGSAGGDHTITATTNGTVVTATATFTVQAAFTISPTEFYANSSGAVTATGTGFDITRTFFIAIDNVFSPFTNTTNGIAPDTSGTNLGRIRFTFVQAGFQPGLHVVALYQAGSGSGSNAPIANATFTVLADPVTSSAGVLAAINATVTTINSTTGTILTNLNAINATVIAINGNVATIRTDTGIIRTNVTTIAASITGISNGFATVQTSVGTLTTTVQSLGSTLSSVSGTVGTISTSVGSLSTDLSAINTKVTSIQNGVATIQTDLGTLQGTVTSTDGKVATIQTSIGTLQASVEDVQTTADSIPGQVNIPIWIAVVLALVAALAAIASLLLVRRKIAG